MGTELEKRVDELDGKMADTITELAALAERLEELDASPEVPRLAVVAADLEERTVRLERRVDELEVPVAGADVATTEVSLGEVTARNVAALLEPVARAVAERHATTVRGLNMELSTTREEVGRTARALERAVEERDRLRGEVLGETDLRGRLEVAERGRRRLELAVDLAVADDLRRGGNPNDVSPASAKESLLERAAAAESRGVDPLEVLAEPGNLPGRKPARFVAAVNRALEELAVAARSTSSEARLAEVADARNALDRALRLAE